MTDSQTVGEGIPQSSNLADCLTGLENSIREFNQKAEENNQATPETEKDTKNEEAVENSTAASETRDDTNTSAERTKKSPLAIAMPPPRNIPAVLQTVGETSSQAEVAENSCPRCGFTSVDKDRFSAHVTSCNPKQASSGLSGKLDKSSSLKNSEKEPIELAYENPYFICKTCDLKLKGRSEFEEHVVCHLLEEPYVCITCTKSFNCRQLLEKHARTSHPNGDSKCGLRGIKKAKRRVEDIEKLGTITLQGKGIIVNSPRQDIKIQPKQSTESLPKSHILNDLLNKETTLAVTPKSSLNISAAQPSLPGIFENTSSISVTSNSGATFVLSTTVSSGNSTNTLSAPNNTSSLFGVINKQSSDLIPASIPVSIQKIAPVNATAIPPLKGLPDNAPYRVKDIKEYSVTPSTPPHTTPANTQSQVVLIPVGPHVSVLPHKHVYGPVQTSAQVNINQTMSSGVVQSLPIFLGPNPPVMHKSQQGVVLTQSTPSVIALVSYPQNSIASSSSAAPSLTSKHSQLPSLLQPPIQLLTLTQSSNIAPAVVKDTPKDAKKSPAPIKGLVQKDPKKFLFRIKPGQGFVCEACKKFTKEELVFRRHVWEHFHGKQLVCKTCSPQNIATKFIIGCQLVNNITCNLIKRSTEEIAAASVNTQSNEVISISDDEEDGSKEDKTGPSAEVVCIEDDNDEETGLNIKISSSFSLTDNKSLEQMTSKCDQLTSLPEKTEECSLGEIQQSVQLDTLDNTCNKEKAPIQLEATPDTEPEKQTTEDATHTNLQKNDANIITMKGTNAKEKGCGEKNTIHEDFKMLARHQKKDSDLPVKESENPVIEGKNKEKLLKEENEIMTQQPDMAFYMCGFEQCSFICLMSSKYRAHLQEKHSPVVNYICSHCGQKDFTEDSHLRHMFTHTNSKKFMLYPCPIKQCKYQTNMLNMYRDHFVIHQHDEHINCVYCHKTFQNAESLVCHLRANLLKFISCPHCSFKFAKRSAVSKHIQVSHPEKPNLVTVTCQVVCLEREVNFYVVPESSGGIDIPALLEEVQKGCLNLKGQGPASKVTELERVQKRLVESGSVSALKSSTDKKKTKERINTSVGPKSLKCPHCTYLSHNQSFYVQHISLHDEEPQREKRFVCHICPKGFDNYAQLKRHVMNHIGRNQLKIFKCTLCTYSSNQKCHIMDHCADSHDGKGMYVEELEEIISNESACKYCEFRARQPEHVAQHESAVHATSSPDYDIEQKRAEETTKCLTEKESEGPKKRKYHCDYCKDFFKHKVDLKQHMQTGHRDIQSKQFTFYKCKHCSYTSTMKDFILNHIHKDHSGKELRILRKIEKIETSKSGISKDTGIAGSTSGDSVENITVMEDRNLLEDEKKEEVAIPDGNTFKQPFKCPKCNFSTNLRIAVMRHIKVHAELKPVRQIKPSSIPSKTTARKSTTRMSVETKDHIPRSTLVQDIPQSSAQLSNPFHSVREVVDELEKEGTNYEDYQLGEQTLHMKLFSCYKYIEEEKKFKCLICKQKITKKFVLHRHILDHLKIVFFKCKYCGEGSIEQSLMTAHIQKEHPGKPLLHEKMSSAELDMQLAERVSSQEFLDVEIKTLSEGSDSSVGVDTPHHIVKRQVHEAISVDDDESESTPVKMRTYSCDKCRYVTTRANHYQLHIESHIDPEKCYYCSACFFRSQRINVIKHMYRAKCKSKSCMCLKDDSVGDQTENQINTVASSVQAKQVDAGEQVTEEDQSNQESNAHIIKVLGKTCPGMKTIYKCKECGFKRESKSALYRHLKSSCKGPRYQCSLCSFQNKTKKNIKVHGRLRHPGKKLNVVDLPTNAKFKEVKVAIKPDDGTTQEKDSLSSTKDMSEPLSPERASSKYQCKICSKYVTDVMTLQFHINTLHGGKSLYCVHCAYKTPLVKHMINHCTHVHRQSSPKYRLHPDDMETDVNDVSNDSFAARKGNWICPSCPYQNGKLSIVKKHLLSHFTYKPYVCKYCGQCSSTLANLKRHFSSAHPRKTENFKKVTDKSKEHAIHAMWAKINRVHPDVSDTNDTSRITTPKKRESHFDASDGPPTPKRQKLDNVESLDVKNEISLDAALKYQVILDTSGTRFFKCSLCDFKAERKLTLQLHLNNHGSKFFKCFYCDYTTKMLTNAIRHHDQKHGDSLIKIVNKKTKEVISPMKKRDPGTSDEEYKPKRIMSITALKYFCNKCPHVCDSLFLYRQHLASHSGFTYLTEASGIDSKLSCGYCAYIASDNTDFSNHISSHLEMRRLKCGYCQFSDHLRKQILVHLRNEHPGQPECVTNVSLQNATAARYQLVNFDPQVVLKRLDVGGVQVKRKFRRIHMETDSESDEENDSSRKSAKPDVVQVEQKATVCNINDQDTVCGERCELKPIHDQEPVESTKSERMDLNSEVIDDTPAKLTDEFGETVMKVNNSEQFAHTVENESRPKADLESKEASETLENAKQVADEIDTKSDETLQGDDGSKQESERNVFDMFNG